MSLSVPAVTEADQRLRRVQILLDQVLTDLGSADKGVARRGKKRPVVLAARCPAILAEAFSELQSFAALLKEAQVDGVALLPQLKNLLPRLAAAESMLAAAAEFYRGWCAAGPAASYPVPGYQAEGMSWGPALLALEA